MFTSGMSGVALYTFSILTFLVAIPSAIKIFNWVATLHKASIDLQTPFLWALCFLFVFMIGGLSGMVLGALSANVHLHDTAFVVAHFHFIVLEVLVLHFLLPFIIGILKCLVVCIVNRGPILVWLYSLLVSTYCTCLCFI